MSQRFLEIQEDLFEYFKNVDDKTFVAVCDLFVFEKGTSDSRVSALTNKFLEDNGIKEAYLNHVAELRRKDKPIFRQLSSEISLIEDIKKAFLVLSHNRLRWATKETSKPKESKWSKLTKEEKDDLKMVLEGCQRHNDNLLEDEDLTRNMFDDEEAEELYNERKRLEKLLPKVLKFIK